MNELQTFNNGDTNYIAKHNANYANLKAAVEALENNLAGQVAAASGPGSAFDALFGPTAAIIGASSYAMTGSGDVLTVAPGFNWKPSIPMVVRNPAPTTLSFAGLAAATYFIYADKTGASVRSTTAGVEDLYSVVWAGSFFGAITRLAPIVWGASDDFAAQTSTALGQTFTTLDSRLEAGEATSAAGALARTWQTGRLSKDVGGSVDVTLSAIEANNTVINLTGTLFANINVIVPLGASPRLWVVTNGTTGAFTLTVKGASGTGVMVPQAGGALLTQDGTNVFRGADAAGAASDAIAVHNAASDPHPQYLTQAEGDARYTAGSAATGVSSVNGHTGAVTLAASDVGAIATTALGAANGAASLDAGGKLPASQLPTGAGGTVTSVSLTTPGLLFDVTGSPVTGAGTLTMTLKTQAKNTFLAGPATGADATPTMRTIAQADLPAQPFDLTAFYPGVPVASAIVTRVPVGRTVTFPAALAGSIGKASVAAAASTAFDVQKNGSSVGTITFAAAATTATFTAASAITLFAGDVLSVIAPSTADATLANVGLVLIGTR